MPGKKNPHKMLQIVLLPPEWLQLVIDITAQLMRMYNKEKGYPPSAQSLLPVLQDAGQSADIVPDSKQPTAHYTGPLALYDFEIRKFAKVDEAKKQNSLDKPLFLDTHMDGPMGGTVFTLTFQIPTETADGTPSKATPTVVGDRLPGGDLLTHIMNARGKPDEMEKLLRVLTEVMERELPETVAEVDRGSGLIFPVDLAHTSAATLKNFSNRVVLTFQIYRRDPTQPIPLFWEKLYGIRGQDWARCLPNTEGTMLQFGTWRPIHNPTLLPKDEVKNLLEEFGDAHAKYLVQEKKAKEEKKAQEQEEVIGVETRRLN